MYCKFRVTGDETPGLNVGIPEVDDLRKYHTDTFCLRNYMDPSKCSINLFNTGRVETGRFGSADMRFSLLDGSPTGHCPQRKLSQEDIDWLVEHAVDKMKAKNFTFADLTRFKYAAACGAVFAAYQHPDFAVQDLELLSTYYISLGVIITDDTSDDNDFSTIEDAETRVKETKALDKLVIKTLKLESIAPEEIAAVTYPDRDVILECYNLYIKYILEVNPDYPRLNRHLVQRFEEYFEVVRIFLRYGLSESRKAPSERKPMSERTYCEFRGHDVGVIFAAEYMVLVYRFEVSDEVRALPQFTRLLYSCSLANGLINDLVSVAKEYDFENEYRSEKSFPMKNLVLIKMLGEGMSLKDAAKYVETLYNSEIEDMTVYGNELMEMFPDDLNVRKYVRYSRWLCDCSLRSYMGLKGRYGYFTMKNMTVTDFRNQKYDRLEEVIEDFKY